MKRLYFVSYYYSLKNGTQGWGAVQIELPCPVATIADIYQAADAIIALKKYKQCVILNWRRFELAEEER